MKCLGMRIMKFHSIRKLLLNHTEVQLEVWLRKPKGRHGPGIEEQRKKIILKEGLRNMAFPTTLLS